jgi:hypothetical protein
MCPYKSAKLIVHTVKSIKLLLHFQLEEPVAQIYLNELGICTEDPDGPPAHTHTHTHLAARCLYPGSNHLIVSGRRVALHALPLSLLLSSGECLTQETLRNSFFDSTRRHGMILWTIQRILLHKLQTPPSHWSPTPTSEMTCCPWNHQQATLSNGGTCGTNGREEERV